MKMKEIKFNKKETETQLIVEVELPRRVYVKEPVVEFSNSDMIDYLKTSGVKIENYDLESQSRKSLTSYSDKANEPILTGTWTYNKKKEKKVNKKTTRPYNKSKENNTGD